MPNSFHPLRAQRDCVGQFKTLWSPLTLGGDCFHYHINDDDSPSAANPSTARRGQAEVRAIQLLKQNAAASGKGCSPRSSCSATPQESRIQQAESLVGGHQRGRSKCQGLALASPGEELVQHNRPSAPHPILRTENASHPASVPTCNAPE